MGEGAVAFCVMMGEECLCECVRRCDCTDCWCGGGGRLLCWTGHSPDKSAQSDLVMPIITSAAVTPRRPPLYHMSVHWFDTSVVLSVHVAAESNVVFSKFFFGKAEKKNNRFTRVAPAGDWIMFLISWLLDFFSHSSTCIQKCQNCKVPLQTTLCFWDEADLLATQYFKLVHHLYLGVCDFTYTATMWQSATLFGKNWFI